MSRYSFIPVHIILSAVAGDKSAILAVLSHYQHYINSFCIRNIYNENQHHTVQVDEQMAKQLETKLFDAILKFKVR
ncbi:hypothetical protein D931_03976 [Enterococcus faecium 13.SD.W.09]|nr:hypothetical protein D931_03976 [Enterococcus faecium 13.SD.W.09]